MSEALSALACRSIRNGRRAPRQYARSWLDQDRSLTATAEAGNESKIQEHHRRKPAYIYLRQSTPGQVLHHRESTERQYALREKARELGWSESLIRTLDQDLGKTGTEMTRREDFKILVADVSMGQVGAVFALEVSRLARSNLDWQRLLELCALTSTLVIDEDGCYDPADFNDGLLLGLKGVMASAELHFLRARLQGGKLHKAQKGELRFPLPVGFCYDAESRIILDPDEEVRGAVSLVFRLFRETGSAFAVMQRFAARALRFPKRSYGGAWDGKLIWGRLTHGRVLGLLKNPSYAGRYVFGRYQYRREISPEVRSILGSTRWRFPTGASACKTTTRDTSVGKSSCTIRSAWRRIAPTVRRRSWRARRAKAWCCSRGCCCVDAVAAG